MPRLLLTALVPALCALAACRSTASEPHEIYLQILQDLDASGHGGLDPEIVARQDERYAQMVLLHQEGRLETAEDHLWASAALASSDRPEHLSLAQTLAVRAAELGDDRGYTIQAHATDKLLVERGAPHQRYGTVIVFRPSLGRHELYPVDPSTTDEVRHAMGIPPLAEILAQVDALNASDETRRLRGEAVPRPDATAERLHPVPRTTTDGG